MTSRRRWIPTWVLLAGAVLSLRAQDPGEPEGFRRGRSAMVDLIARRGVKDSATLAAMRAVARHQFVPAQYRTQAYEDHPIPIGLGQTISQPYIVAYMTEAVRPRPGLKVLEVGTGSGYQAAVLAQIGCRVFTIEIFPQHADSARARLQRLGVGNVSVRQGDGHFGWREEAPFQAILVTAAAGYIPPDLIDQLANGGRMLIPVGSPGGVQQLTQVEKDTRGKVTTRSLLPVAFVPLLHPPDR